MAQESKSWREFWSALDSERGKGACLEPHEIVQIAIKSGLSAADALEALRHHSSIGAIHARDPEAPLWAFLARLIDATSPHDILEYSVSAPIIAHKYWQSENGPQYTCVTPDTALQKALDVISQEGGAQYFGSLKDIPSRHYDLIVLRPPMGGTQEDKANREILFEATRFLRQGDTLIWITQRTAMERWKARNTFEEMRETGMVCTAAIDLPSGTFRDTALPGGVFLFQSSSKGRRFVAALRDSEMASDVVRALYSDPAKKEKLLWAWIDDADYRQFVHIEQERTLRKYRPTWKAEDVKLRDVSIDDNVAKANKLDPTALDSGSWLFLPEYAGSRATSILDDQTVKASSVFALQLDSSRVNARFLVRIINSAYGRRLREYSARGATIQRLKKEDILELTVPLPVKSEQDRIARLDSELAAVRAEIEDLDASLDRTGDALDVAEKEIGQMKEVFDIDQQIASWWRELPYPLAVVYRRYCVLEDSKERFEALIHFFELTSIFVAQIGVSHALALREDAEAQLKNWFYPKQGSSIEHAGFGLWCMVGRQSLKAVNQVVSDPELKSNAEAKAGLALLQAAEELSGVRRPIEPLDEARRLRNDWVGHGGRPRRCDYEAIVKELEAPLRELFESTSRLFRRLLLVRVGRADVMDDGIRHDIELLIGSDPRFAQDKVEVRKPIRRGELAFWLRGAAAMCPAVPLIRLETPDEPGQTAVYALNRARQGEFRWVSYEEAPTPEIVEAHGELAKLIQNV